MQCKVGQVEVMRHRRLNDLIATQIRSGGDFRDHPTRKRATITGLPQHSIPRDLSSYYTRGPGWNPEFQTNEYKLIVTSLYNINGSYYRITTYSFIPSF